MPRIQVGSLGMYYEVQGAGAPVLLIGGLGADLTLHQHLIAELAGRGHRVIAFDNRGAGRTDKPDTPYTIEGMADDTLGLLDALHLDRVHVVGISMGSRIAIELAARCRDRVDKLVLVSTSAAGTGRIRMSVPMRLMSVAQWIPSLHGKYPQPRSAHQRQRQASTSYDGTGRLEQIHTPTLIMHGRRDKSIPLSRAEALHKAIAGSQLRVFAGGHMFCFLTERDEFLAQIDRFLTS